MDNSRRKNRRSETRRKEERRVISFEFGSQEWLDMITELYFLCPKEDQRVQARRVGERRELERRQSPSLRQKQDANLLSDEERQMLTEIWATG